MITLESAGVVVETPDGPSEILAPTSQYLEEPRIAVIGANGSGKSTLARLLNGLRAPTSGRVLVDELDTVRDAAAVRAHVGFMFSDADAQLVMPTPLEDVALSLRRRRLRRTERTAAAQEILHDFGLGAVAQTPIQALSGGQKQLLALAGVLATAPHVLVCDEPTTRLDLRWREQINALLDSLPLQVIMITHDLDLAARTARVLVVDKAHVVADLPGPQAVERYRALVSSRRQEEPGPAFTTCLTPTGTPRAGHQ